MTERIARGVYRGAYCCLLDDQDFQVLRPQSRHVLLTMRLSKEAGPACIWLYRTEVIAEQTGLSVRAVEAALHELETSPSPEDPWILRQGRLLWIRNGLRYDPTIRLTDKFHVKAVTRAVAALPRCDLVDQFCAYYALPLEATRRHPVDNGGQLASPPATTGPPGVLQDLPKKGPAKVLGDLLHPRPSPRPNTSPRPSSRAIDCGQVGKARTGGDPTRAATIATQVLSGLSPPFAEKYGPELGLMGGKMSAAPPPARGGPP